MRAVQLLLSLVLLVSVPGEARQPSIGQATDAETIGSVVRRAATRFLTENPQAVGVSIGVIADGRSYRYAFGRARRNEPNPPSFETLYPIASISKTFTGALLARAQVERRLRLSDDVRLYLEGRYPNLEFAGKPIRLFDLLDHRSGLPFFLPDRPETKPDYNGDGKTWNERVADIARTYRKSDFLSELRSVTLRAEPGTTFSYSNAGAQLAGYVLENIYGRSFESILKAKLLEPLHMTHTTITIRGRFAPSLAVGYDATGKAMAPVPDWLQGAGAIKSTLGDMLKYTKWQLAESDEVVKLSHQPVLTQGTYSAGLNWQILHAGTKRIIWQEGNVEGFNSLCILEPELGLGIVILANEEDPKSAHGNTIMANDILHGLSADAVLLPTN